MPFLSSQFCKDNKPRRREPSAHHGVANRRDANAKRFRHFLATDEVCQFESLCHAAQ